jgi:hypothetical protein
MSNRWLLSLCSVVLLVSSLALGQGTTSRISGVVTDSTGAVVANATVTAVNEGTGSVYAMKTSSGGSYTFDLLQVGRYTIKTEAPGFKQFMSTGNVLAIGVPTSVNPKLEIGGGTEVVTVQGGYDLVQTESSGNFGAMIDSVTLTQLPIVGTRGRNPLGLVQYVPGVVVNGANATGGGISVNGSRDRAWNYVMDGIDANESSSGGSNTSPPHQNPDMLSEFRVITSAPTAEFGRNSGAQVIMVTKSGTNQWHGNLFWFYQSPFLRANTPQNKATTPITPRSQYVQNVPGGSLGGPIWKDKAFFFVNVELLHASTSSLVTRTVYTPQARQGLFRYASSGRNQPSGASGASVDPNGNPIVPYSTYDMVANDPFHKGLDPSMKQFLALAPLPNTYQTGDGLNYAGYSFVAPAIDKQVDVTFKIDYRFNDKNAVYFRWVSGHQNTYADSTNAGLQTFPGLPAVVNTFRLPRNFAFNYRWSPTSRLTNEFVVGMNRFGYRFENPAGPTNQKTPYNPNLVTAPLNSYLGNNRYLTTIQLVDNVTMVRGPHVFKTGINFRYGREIDQRGSIGSLNAIPQVTFSTGSNPVNTAQYKTPSTGINTSNDQPNLYSAINDILGRVGSLQAGYVAQPDLAAFKPAGTINNMDHRWPEYDFYVQDTWHALPNLVLDFGLRLDARQAPDLHSFPGLVPNQSVNYGTPLTKTMQFVHGPFMDNRWTNFGPSVGFAWDPMKDGKTSIRGNFRIAFDRINSFSFSSSVFQGMPGLTYQVTNSTIGQDNFSTGTAGMRAANWAPPAPTATPLALTTPPAYSLNTLTVSDPSMQTPTVSMWGLSIQRELIKNTVFTLTYIGNHGTHLYGGYDTNQAEIYSNNFLTAFQQVQAGQDSPLMTQIISSDTRRLTGESGTKFIQRNYASNLSTNNVAGLATSLSTRLQNATTANPNGVPLVVSSGLPASFFKPYSQYLGGMYVLQTRDYSNYNGLQAQIEKRFSRGFLITANYTYSKSLDTRSFDPTFTLVATGSSQSASSTPFDYRKPSLNYAAADFDNTHVVNGYYVLDMPFGHGRKYGSQWNRPLDWIAGGWQISGDGYWQSGRPLTIFAGSNTYGTSVQTPASCDHCDAHMGKVHTEIVSGVQQTFYLTPEQRAKFYIPAAGQFGNTGRNWLRQNATWSMDANVSKSFRTWKEQYLQLRFEVQNVMNTRSYDTMGSQLITSTVFARLNAATDGVTNSSPRRAQLAAKYVF